MALVALAEDLSGSNVQPGNQAKCDPGIQYIEKQQTDGDEENFKINT